MDITYNWQVSIAIIAATAIFIKVAKLILFQIPPFKRTLEVNLKENKRKYKEDTRRNYPGRLKTSKIAAFAPYILFFVGIVPFTVSFDAKPAWVIALNVFLILMVYDFFYYCMHRFLFHGKGYFRRVHAVHHQARSPTSIDSLLLDPMEAFLGVFLYVVVTSAFAFYALANGGSMSWITILITMIIYTQINTFNHVKVDLPYFPFKILNWIAYKHSVHHIDMHKGNYATITLFFDKIFGTLD